ncbi:MAG: hypothetical protein ACRC78_15350 [Planktothrix sp.]
MTNKKQTRKPLSDALAQEFVYGENFPPAVTPKPPETVKVSEPVPTPESTPVPTPVPTPESTPVPRQQQPQQLMNQLQAIEPKEPTKRFTVDLPESMHRKLSILAARTGRHKSEIVKFLLDQALKDVQE